MSAEEVLARLNNLEREAATLRQELAIARQGAVTLQRGDFCCPNFQEKNRRGSVLLIEI